MALSIGVMQQSQSQSRARSLTLLGLSILLLPHLFSGSMPQPFALGLDQEVGEVEQHLSLHVSNRLPPSFTLSLSLSLVQLVAR